MEWCSENQRSAWFGADILQVIVGKHRLSIMATLLLLEALMAGSPVWSEWHGPSPH
jgi:hypothetical protein